MLTMVVTPMWASGHTLSRLRVSSGFAHEQTAQWLCWTACSKAAKCEASASEPASPLSLTSGRYRYCSPTSRYTQPLPTLYHTDTERTRLHCNSSYTTGYLTKHQ
jgi:hypothetical protein